MTDTVLPLRREHRGEPVRDLQDRLVAFAATVDGPSSLDEEPGWFGPGTEELVRWFQSERGLTSDGVVGRQTWAALVEAGYSLGARLLYLTKPMLRGDDVAELQRRLGGLGFDAGRVDGIFGPDTADATGEFQRNAGLVPDSIAGPETIAAIRRLGQRSAVNQTVTHVREAEALRATKRSVRDLRVVVVDRGGASPLSDALGRHLGGSGAQTIVLHDPDPSRVAASANQWDAHVVVCLASAIDASVAYYGRRDFVSAPGRRLALLLEEGLHGVPGHAPPTVMAMTVPLLRETRMPTVMVDVGPPELVVEHSSDLCSVVVDALDRWAHDPT